VFYNLYAYLSIIFSYCLTTFFCDFKYTGARLNLAFECYQCWVKGETAALLGTQEYGVKPNMKLRRIMCNAETGMINVLDGKQST
jgi:hypothetical protein